ncbi:class I SAM-dependent methyltransferase [Streptomyces sp. NPDC057697]|uniref:class I SAM-dependent methyltransferase n=1 Tax=Streptomyces sp. NPDC057697 TaxID=3346219 RepID=UPI0036CEC7D1
MSQHTGHGPHPDTAHSHHPDPAREGHRHTPHAHHQEAGDIDWDVMGPMLEQEAEVGCPQYEAAARWIAGLRTAPKVRRVPDIGSGPGVISCLLAEVFPEAEVVAVDGTPALLERTRDHAERLGLGDRVRTHHADIPDDLDALGEADLIWAGNALHHMGDQRAVLAGFAALLRPGGIVALAEGGLQPRRLPRDIGIGRPGLEARLEAIQVNRFEEMRAALPGSKRETEDWGALLAAAGLTPQGTRSFLLDLPAPLAEGARDHVITEFARRRQMFEEELAAEDVAVLDRLLDPEDPAGLRRRPDLFLLSARTVHLGRRD